MSDRRAELALLLVLLICPAAFAGDSHVHRMVEPVAGQYLVKLKTRDRALVPSLARTLAAEHSGALRGLYVNAIRGFCVQMSDASAEALSRDPRVEFVEEVAYVHPSYSDTLSSPLGDPGLYHLDALDGVNDGKYTYCEKGANVVAYELGRGVWRDHTEFKRTDGSSRVERGAKFANDNCVAPGDAQDYGYWPCTVNTDDDHNHYNGHDTAAASVLGGKTYGVAKEVTIVPIRMYDQLGGQSTTEYFNYSVDWIMSSDNPYRDQRPAAVSISSFVNACPGTDLYATFLEQEIDALLGYDYNSATNTCSTPHVVDAAYTWSGIPVVVSANNHNTSANYTSPARMAWSNTSFSSCMKVISVGGIDETNQRWVCRRLSSTEPCGGALNPCTNAVVDPPGSNYGPTVDIYAPAHKLTLASINCTTCDLSNEGLRSGTSYAAPIAAGVVARLQARYGTLSPTESWTYLENNAVTPSAPINDDPGKKIVRLAAQEPCTVTYP